MASRYASKYFSREKMVLKVRLKEEFDIDVDLSTFKRLSCGKNGRDAGAWSWAVYLVGGNGVMLGSQQALGEVAVLRNKWEVANIRFNTFELDSYSPADLKRFAECKAVKQ